VAFQAGANAGWRGNFYPEGLPHRRELGFASGVFNSVEINGSFYSLQRPSSYQRWYAATPPDFVFTVKGGRFITHVKNLHDIETPLASFFGSGVLALREKIGPILWQLPPNLAFDPERLRNFLELLPRNTKQASDLAAKHNEKLKGHAFLKIDPAAAGRPLCYALEVPHPSFMTADFFELLRRRTIAFVIADTAKKFPYTEDLTADFVYCRLHGDKELCAAVTALKRSIGGPIVSSIGAQAGNRETPISSPRARSTTSAAMFLFILTMTRRSTRPTTLFV
jgi:uncharacterized protein YecE (DUF72 family)